MLTNATITRIDRPTAPDAAGRPRRSTGPDVSVRCAVDQVNSHQRLTLGAAIEQATLVVYVPAASLASANESPPVGGDRLTLRVDGDPSPMIATVITTGDRAAPGAGALTSHTELFVRREP